MVAEHGSDSAMTMNGFDQSLASYQSIIRSDNQEALLLHSMLSQMFAGFGTFHTHTVDSNARISSLDVVTQQNSTNLNTLANQFAQYQSSSPGPQQQTFKKGILEFKVIQNIRPLTGNRSQFRQWHQKLINALSTIKESHAEIIRTLEKSMDVGDKIPEALDDLDQQYHLDDFNKDMTCILMDKCDGEAYDKIKGLQNLKGAEIYMVIYRWLTEISGLGLSMQAAKLMNPDPIKKESELEHAVDKWSESNRKLESHGSQFGLAPLYKVIALKKLMVGRAKEHFDLWEAEHKQEPDCGFAKILDKVRDYSRKAKLESSATDKKNSEDDVEMNSIRKQKEKIAKEKETEEKWWEEYINAISKGKGKGKSGGFQGTCYNCGEFGHSIRNCTKELKNQKGGKDQGKGEKGSKGGGKGKGYLGTCWTCGVVGHSWNNCPINGKGGKSGSGSKGGWNTWQPQNKGKGGVWSADWGDWSQPKEEDEEIKFGHQAAETEDEPQDEDDLGAVDLPFDISPPPENIWTQVPRKKNRFVNKNRVPLANFISSCADERGCSHQDCIERAASYIESDDLSADPFDMIGSVEKDDPKIICSVNQDREGFENIRIQVDSGAVDTVGPKSVGRAFEIKKTLASKSGRHYVAANGSAIKNYGERLIKGETENGLKVSMPLQIADVRKVLMSTHRMNETGLKVVLDGHESFFIEKTSGKSTPIRYESGKYFFDIWAPSIRDKKTRDRRVDDDAMDCNQTAKISGIRTKNRFEVLGTDQGF